MPKPPSCDVTLRNRIFLMIQINLEQKRKESDVKFCMKGIPKYPIFHLECNG